MTALLDLALAAHGGLDRWRDVHEVRARVRTGGVAFALKRQAGALAELEATVAAHAPRSVLAPFPRPGQRGVFDAGAVRVETDAGELVAERADPRPLFRTARRQVSWDALDALYFAGYAVCNYLTTPFVLARPGFETRELAPRGGLRRLAVRFPEDFPTHSREQVMHFDAGGLLRRLDYTAEPFGRWARGAHRCLAHADAGGIVFAVRRRVVPRAPGGRALPGPTIVSVAFDDISVA